MFEEQAEAKEASVSQESGLEGCFSDGEEEELETHKNSLLDYFD